jgi:hypothetical protein
MKVDWLLSSPEGEPSDPAQKDPFLCPQNAAQIHNSPRNGHHPGAGTIQDRPCSIRSLLSTHGGVMNMPSAGLSPGTAVNLDFPWLQWMALKSLLRIPKGMEIPWRNGRGSIPNFGSSQVRPLLSKPRSPTMSEPCGAQPT